VAKSAAYMRSWRAKRAVGGGAIPDVTFTHTRAREFTALDGTLRITYGGGGWRVGAYQGEHQYLSIGGRAMHTTAYDTFTAAQAAVPGFLRSLQSAAGKHREWEKVPRPLRQALGR